VARSIEYVQSGTTALADAKMLQKKTRKWMCCAIILLLVTAAVIVIVVSGCNTVVHSVAVRCKTA
jgi:syntaxin 1B/2/3